MKRFALVMVALAAMVGCQSPGGSQGMLQHQQAAGLSYRPTSPTFRNSVTPAAPKGSVASTAKADPNVTQVGYNTGWGAIQNNNYRARVARAIPSHGGELPGGIQYPFTAEDAAAFGAGGGPAGPGGPMGHSHGPGGGGPGCAACAAAGMGGPGPGAGMQGPPPGVGMMPRFISGRTQVRFTRPNGMKIAWLSEGQFTPPQLEAPARYNFYQARIYRLKLTEIENRPGLELYPTLEVYPGNVKVDAYLAHNAVPIEFTEEDFDQVSAGNFVTKVIYLPDPKFQELAIAGVETLVSTRLDPGIDPVQEASRRGVILAVLRIGSVDLEMPHSPALFSAPPMAVPGPVGVAPAPPLGPQAMAQGPEEVPVLPGAEEAGQ
ncbi:hypothetical protein K2Y11_24745 [bacterium]|nr:hypothetical protein [bacterium]